MRGQSAFRDRKSVFVVLLVVLAVNGAALLSYRTFYDDRLQALVNEQASLETRRDDARRKAADAAVAERKLFETQEVLTSFFSETLGQRKERIAPLIEEIYDATRKAGLRPDSISYSSKVEPGTDALTMNFNVSGPYEAVKRLLATFERSKRFLVIEQVGLSGGRADDPNAVSVALTLTNHFRPESARQIRRVREARGAPLPRPAAPSPARKATR